MMKGLSKVLPYSEVQTTEKPTEKQQSDRDSVEDPLLLGDVLQTQDSTRFLSAKDGVIGRWMIRQSDPWRVRWDLFVMLCAVYNCFIVPYEIAFMDGAVHIDLLVVAVLVDVVFTFDIFFNFRTTFIDHVTGDEVTDPHKISHHYIKSGHLLLDILATLPFDLFVGAAGFHHSGLKLTTLLKLIHILRLSKIINNIRLSESKKIAIRIAQIVLSVVMYVHCIGCAWAVIVEIKEKWMPQSEGAASDFYETDDKAKKYSFSLYHAVYMWAGVEINPQTSLEMFYLIFVVILGSIIRAVLFGKMAVLMSGLNKDSARISAILGTVNTSMMNMQLPEALQLKIIDYLLSTQATLARQEEFELFMQLIPPTLQTAVGEVIYREIATACPVLKKHPDMFRPLIQKLRIKFVPPETKLISQGEDGDLFFYLVKGLCEVEVCDEQKRLHRVKVLAPGQYFGELALLYNTPRTASVRSFGYSTIGELKKDDFLGLRSQFPDFMKRVELRSKRYKDPWGFFITAALKRVPYFKELPDDVLTLLMHSLRTKSMDKDEMLFTEGDTLDCLYIVTEGSLNLYVDLKTKIWQGFFQEHYCQKSRRDCLHEQQAANKSSLKRNGTVSLPKTASPYLSASMKLECVRIGNILCASQAILRAEAKVNCIAIEPVTLLWITAHDIEDLMKTSQALKHGVEAIRAKRLKFDAICGEVLKLVPPIDLTRSFRDSTPLSRRVWKSHLKLKNSVIAFLLRKRQARQSGLLDVKSMVLRIKSMMKAEDAGYISLARKIASGVINTQAVEAIGLLNEHELMNPLLIQFTVEVKEVVQIATNLQSSMAKLTEIVEPHTTFRDINSVLWSTRQVVEHLETVL
jgi:CRP-like cAMP-binding protein